MKKRGNNQLGKSIIGAIIVFFMGSCYKDSNKVFVEINKKSLHKQSAIVVEFKKEDLFDYAGAIGIGVEVQKHMKATDIGALPTLVFTSSDGTKTEALIWNSKVIYIRGSDGIYKATVVNIEAHEGVLLHLERVGYEGIKLGI